MGGTTVINLPVNQSTISQPCASVRSVKAGKGRRYASRLVVLILRGSSDAAAAFAVGVLSVNPNASVKTKQ